MLTMPMVDIDANISPTTTIFQSQSINSSQENLTLEQVAEHSTENDCWIIVYDRVYDITTFLNEHPGGKEILLDYAGQDATFAFLDSHASSSSSVANKLLNQYQIGLLTQEERMFRHNNNLPQSE